jgi:uncharacterized membrane protein
MVHLHLLLTHAPIFFSLIGLGILVAAAVRRSSDLRVTAYCLLVLAGLLTIPVYLTGEASEDTVKQLAGVTETTIEQHADAAKLSLIGSELLGLLALFGLLSKRIAPKVMTATTTVVLLVGAVVVLSFANTANLGGQIRHTEIQSSIAPSR